MIEELTTYMKGIQEQFPLRDFEKEPTAGLHIMFELVDDEIKLYEKELYLPKPKEEGNPSKFLVQECLPRELHANYVESNKALKDKKIHSATPFCVKVRKKTFDKEWIKWYPKKEVPSEAKILEKELKEKSHKERKEKEKEILERQIICAANGIQKAFSEYFEKANEICLDNKPDENTLKFQNYIIQNSSSILTDSIDQLSELKNNDYIFLWFKNKTEEEHEEAHRNYLGNYIFNVNTYNRIVEGNTFGLNGYMNNDSNDKKYLKHLTANFNINFRIEEQKAFLLRAFENYRKAKAFKTTPLPVFIDYPELNDTVINVINEEGNNVKFNAIIRKLHEERKSDLGNYYLLFIDYRGELKDLDFVSSFNFGLDVKIKSIFSKPDSANDKVIRNIFQFEIEILTEIFSNKLIQRRKEGRISYRYFEDIDNNPKYITQVQWHLVMKYRRAFYDWIYKSRRQSITDTMFQDIMLNAILDDIRQDEYKNNEHTKYFNIRNKLNIWFSLWNFFKQTDTSNQLTMANKIVALQERMRILRENNDQHIQTDDELAFTIGQVIYYLLSKSKAGNKSHSLLEPFIQKTNDKELKKTLVSTFNAYKHEISFGKGRFEKLFGEVMGFEYKGNIQDLTPLILAGYFSNSTIYEGKENNDN